MAQWIDVHSQISKLYYSIPVALEGHLSAKEVDDTFMKDFEPHLSALLELAEKWFATSAFYKLSDPQELKEIPETETRIII